MPLSKNTKLCLELTWRVLNEFALLVCWIAVYSILILCAIIVMSAQVKADEVEKYEQKLYLMESDFAVIITNQPCHIETVKDALKMFVYARKTNEDKTIEYIGGCYSEKDNSVVIWWEKGGLISIPTRNFKNVTEV